jgi:hypothetical protein
VLELAGRLLTASLVGVRCCVLLEFTFPRGNREQIVLAECLNVLPCFLWLQLLLDGVRPEQLLQIVPCLFLLVACWLFRLLLLLLLAV